MNYDYQLIYQTETKLQDFFWVTWRDDVWVKINVNYLSINISGIKQLKRRYSVLLGLADNWLGTNLEKTSLMQDSILDMAGDACSRENEIYIWVSSA